MQLPAQHFRVWLLAHTHYGNGITTEKKKNKNKNTMPQTTANFKNIGKQSPRWFRILKKCWANTETFVIAILLMMGYASDSFAMLIVKMGTQTLFENLETILAVDEPQDQNQTS